MVEPIMFAGLGFLVASLLALIFLPLIHARAVRLTAKRIQASTPVSVAEIQADKDQLRAEFAMSTRRLEMSVEQLKNKTTSQLAELGKKTEAINALKSEVGEKAATIFALEARDKAMKEQLRTTEEEFNVKSNTLRETERKLSDTEAELARVSAELSETSVTADSQRIELVALKTQAETLKDQIADLENELADTQGRLSRERADAQRITQELAEERSTVEKLAARISQLERQLAAQIAETEMLDRRIAELEAELADQNVHVADLGRERDQLRLELATLRRTELSLQEEIFTTTRHHEGVVEALRTEKMLAEGALERSREERVKLQRELTALKREAETTWANERVESALLRERINDVAAEVARLTTTLEGPGSPIDTILAADEIGAPRNGNGMHRGGIKAANSTGGTLADRIRALQSRASRVASPS
jgi:chromosome segregation ATPase